VTSEGQWAEARVSSSLYLQLIDASSRKTGHVELSVSSCFLTDTCMDTYCP
jgi:hypothetical protein